MFYFLSWLYFVSSVGCISFPQLAVFRFLSWPYFVSSVGIYLLVSWRYKIFWTYNPYLCHICIFEIADIVFVIKKIA